MRILIEEHQYQADKVDGIIEGLTNFRNVKGKVSVSHVGYYYNPRLEDTVFILPKVLMEEKDGMELLFGNYPPEDIINLEEQTLLTKEEYNFIYELAVWIYRAIVVFRDTHPDNNIVLQQLCQQMDKGRLHKCNTYLDILLALQRFNKENQDFLMFVTRNQHSGMNKINWTRTISHNQAVIQDGTPFYPVPINKKRQINFDEELLVIYYSILNFIHEHYGFPVKLNLNFDLIKGERFENYREHLGCARLKQIKYKYFSDKALYLWELCFAFFNRSKDVNVNTNQKEYLLAKNFNIVFEAIIDELIAGDQHLPAELTEQEDGKRVDHMYQYRNLTNNEEDNPIYYIGDSKYYKRNHPISGESVYKQFTYARNVVQWNLNLFNDPHDEAEREGHQKLMDEVTEGYNVIPNFFISAQQNTLKEEGDIRKTPNTRKEFFSRHFDNRLYDRDTFIIAHYDVNFLFVVAMYGRANSSEKTAWRGRVRKMFRTEIQNMIQERFNFHVMTPKEGVSAVAYLESHFQQLLGKVYTPYEDRGTQKYYSLALDNRQEYAAENEALLGQLEEFFYIKPCESMGDDPKKLLPEVEPMVKVMSVPMSFLTMHYLENYATKEILVGMYHDEDHLKWILGNNDKGTLIYNVRLDKTRQGSIPQSHLLKKEVAFVLLYEDGHQSENNYRVFRVHHHATMTEDRMRKARYPKDPQGKYFCYVFSEEVTLGNLDVSRLLSEEQTKSSYIAGAPLFLTGEELIQYRKNS